MRYMEYYTNLNSCSDIDLLFRQHAEKLLITYMKEKQRYSVIIINKMPYIGYII